MKKIKFPLLLPLFLTTLLIIVSPSPLFSSDEITLGDQIEANRNVIEESTLKLELDPEDLDARLSRGTSYFHLSQLYMLTYGPILADDYLTEVKDYLTKATEDFTIVIESNPERDEVYLMRGMCFGLMGLTNAAMSDFNAVIEMDPENAGAYYARGREFWERGEYKKAKKDYERACELDPGWKGNFYSR